MTHPDTQSRQEYTELSIPKLVNTGAQMGDITNEMF
jgi:hypothetical protein